MPDLTTQKGRDEYVGRVRQLADQFDEHAAALRRSADSVAEGKVVVTSDGMSIGQQRPLAPQARSGAIRRRAKRRRTDANEA
jgi:hypothetical protein